MRDQFPLRYSLSWCEPPNIDCSVDATAKKKAQKLQELKQQQFFMCWQKAVGRHQFLFYCELWHCEKSLTSLAHSNVKKVIVEICHFQQPNQRWLEWLSIIFARWHQRPSNTVEKAIFLCTICWLYFYPLCCNPRFFMAKPHWLLKQHLLKWQIWKIWYLA